MELTQDVFKRIIVQCFRNRPNSSPAVLIQAIPNNGLTAGAICVLRECENVLELTGIDKNGFALLSVNENNAQLYPVIDDLETFLSNLE